MDHVYNFIDKLPAVTVILLLIIAYNSIKLLFFTNTKYTFPLTPPPGYQEWKRNNKKTSHMDAKSQEKVIKAGFTIIRQDDQPSIRIKYKGPKLQDWHTLEKFETKAARDRRFAEMLQDPKTIQD